MPQGENRPIIRGLGMRAAVARIPNVEQVALYACPQCGPL